MTLFSMFYIIMKRKMVARNNLPWAYPVGSIYFINYITVSIKKLVRTNVDT